MGAHASRGVAACRGEHPQLLVGQRHGVYRWDEDPDPSVVEAKVAGAGWRFVHLDSAGVEDRTEFMERCWDAFDLPLGTDWEVLDTYLRAMDLEGADGLLVLWTGWAELAAADPDWFETAVEVFNDACVAWRDDEVPGGDRAARRRSRTDLPDL